MCVCVFVCMGVWACQYAYVCVSYLSVFSSKNFSEVYRSVLYSFLFFGFGFVIVP